MTVTKITVATQVDDYKKNSQADSNFN